MNAKASAVHTYSEEPKELIERSRKVRDALTSRKGNCGTFG